MFEGITVERDEYAGPDAFVVNYRQYGKAVFVYDPAGPTWVEESHRTVDFGTEPQRIPLVLREFIGINAIKIA